MPLGAIGDDLTDLDGAVAEALERRLDRTSRRPLAVALSGGGDSLALALGAAAWARRAGRALLILTVDHGVQAESPAWTEACRARAAGLGADFRALRWAGAKPAAGLPAAARAARHRLLADAAREAGAAVILMGHTADDVLEARAMRQAGATTPEPRDWGPSPVWPGGRGIFLLRPLLGLRRTQIRAWLQARGEDWIEDPANADLRFARARARAMGPGELAPPAETQRPDALAQACRMDTAGVLIVERARLRAAPAEAADAFVGIACLCAAGTERPPAGARRRRLAQALRGAGPVAATLAGARIEADAHEARFLREAGEMARGGLSPLTIPAGATAVWDGRFEIAAEAGLEIRPLKGLAAGLAAEDRARLAAVPARARPTLPVAVSPEGVRLAAGRALALERLRAACGLVEREPA